MTASTKPKSVKKTRIWKIEHIAWDDFCRHAAGVAAAKSRVLTIVGPIGNDNSANILPICPRPARASDNRTSHELQMPKSRIVG